MSVSDPKGRQDGGRRDAGSQAGERSGADQPLSDLARRLAAARQAGDPAPEELERLVSMLATSDIQAGDRLTGALEGLARWSESAKAPGPQPARESSSPVAPYPQDLPRTDAPPPRQAQASAPDELEARLADFAKTLTERPKPAAAEPAPLPETPPAPEAPSFPRTPPIASLRSALAEIAARQKALDADEEPAPRARPAAPAEGARLASATPPLGTPSRAETVSPSFVGDLRVELDRLGRTVSDLPTRAEIDGLTREMTQLANRLGQDRPARLDRDSLKAIDALVAEVDRMRSDAASPQMIVDLAEELHAISTRLDGLGQPNSDAVEALSRRIDELRAELEQFPRAAAVEGVAVEIQGLIERLDAQEREAAPTREAVAGLSGRVEALDGRIAAIAEATVARDDAFDRINEAIRAELDTLPRAEAVTDLGRQIDALTEGLKSRSAIGPALKAVEGLADRVEALDGKIVAMATRGDAERLAGAVRSEIAGVARADALSGLGRQIEALTASLAAPLAEPVEALSGRIDGLGDRMEAMAAATRARGAAFERIEDSVRSIAEQLLASRAEPNAEASPALAAEVARVAASFEASGERIEDLHEAFAGLASRIERSCADLGAHCVESAVTAARQAFGGGANDVLPDEISRTLAELRASTAQSERRASDTLDAVRATLERMLERMENEAPVAPPIAAPVEPARSEPRRVVEGPAVDPTEAARAAARRAMAEMSMAESEAQSARTPPRSDADAAFFRPYADLAPDHPLEPGALGRAEPGAPSEPQSAAQVTASFIAAARRAAAQPAAEEDEPFAPAEQAAGKPARLSGALGALKARRRPLLLGLAAALIVFAALYVASGMTGEPEPEPALGTQSELAPAPQPRSADDAAGEAGPARAAVEAEAPRSEPSPQPAARAETAPPVAEAPTPAAQLAAPPANEWKQAAPATTGSIARPGDELPDQIGGPTLRIRAVSGDPSAQLEIADRLLDGRNVEPNAAAAAKWFEKAAAQGLAPAQHRLGSLYEKGRGVARDMQAARRWYEQAAASGNVRAMHNLGVVHAEGGLGKPDFDAATVWFRMSADRGLVDSQYNLAVLCARGLGGKRDLVEAYKWFALAADQGDQDAAKKRDDVGKALGKALGVAKAAVAQFRPRAVDAAANEAPAPAGGWDRVAEKAEGAGRSR